MMCGIAVLYDEDNSVHVHFLIQFTEWHNVT